MIHMQLFLKNVTIGILPEAESKAIQRNPRKQR